MSKSPRLFLAFQVLVFIVGALAVWSNIPSVNLYIALGFGAICVLVMRSSYKLTSRMLAKQGNGDQGQGG